VVTAGFFGVGGTLSEMLLFPADDADGREGERLRARGGAWPARSDGCMLSIGRGGSEGVKSLDD
jgi:hypothetical protein